MKCLCLWLLAISFFVPSVGVADGEGDPCEEIFAALLGDQQIVKNAFDPETGQGYILFSRRPYISDEDVQTLLDGLPDNQMVTIINRGITKVDELTATKGVAANEKLIKVLNHIADFLRALETLLNTMVSPSERGKIRIDVASVRKDNGKGGNGQFMPHVDSSVMSALINLAGATTIYADPRSKEDYMKISKSVDPQTVLVFNGISRSQRVSSRGPGVEPMVHASPRQTGQPRLPIIVFFR
jgi:hypothetical protein